MGVVGRESDDGADAGAVTALGHLPNIRYKTKHGMLARGAGARTGRVTGTDGVLTGISAGIGALRGAGKAAGTRIVDGA